MNAPASTVPNAAAPNGRRNTALIVVTIIILLGALVWWLLWHFIWSIQETTDDGYVAGNLVSITSQTMGTVTAVLADDTQRVEAGQTLVRLDPTDAQVALQRAAAALAQSVRQISQQSDTATEADAAVHSRQLELQKAQSDLQRRQPLLATHAISAEELRHAADAVELAKAALDGARREASAAHSIVEGSDTLHQPSVQQARAAYVQAWIDAQRGAIPTPISGYVAQRSVQLGQRIAPGQALMTVIPLDNLWINANFKESQLRNLRIGQKATITTDLYGSKVDFHGRVEGVSAGTGAAFALLPAQNASGNWIKVVQRVPVRIALDPKELAQRPLRIGLSTDVTVDITDRSGPVLAATPVKQDEVGTDIYAQQAAQAAAHADAIIAAAMRGHR